MHLWFCCINKSPASCCLGPSPIGEQGQGMPSPFWSLSQRRSSSPGLPNPQQRESNPERTPAWNQCSPRAAPVKTVKQTASQMEGLELQRVTGTMPSFPQICCLDQPSKGRKGLHHLTLPDKETEDSSGRTRPGFLLSGLLTSLLLSLTPPPSLPTPHPKCLTCCACLCLFFSSLVFILSFLLVFMVTSEPGACAVGLHPWRVQESLS